jgi:NADH-quinone oxidoreductase subunit J
MIMLIAVVAVLGLWLLLPRRTGRARGIGVVLAAISLGLLGLQTPRLADWLSECVFDVLASVTLVAAAAAITLRNPVYCAIWFGMSLLGTAGLFLFQGAQFLAVATVVVYAGAILVTFLFVLMLAEPSGQAVYDRTNWEGAFSVVCGVFLISVLSMTVMSVLETSNPPGLPVAVFADDRQKGVLSAEPVALLGQSLFSRHLIAVEVAGILLLVALIGAAVIIGRARGPLAGPLEATNGAGESVLPSGERPRRPAQGNMPDPSAPSAPSDASDPSGMPGGPDHG